MAQRPPKPAEMPWVLSYMPVKDPAAALGFYERAFGFEPRPQGVLKGPDGAIMHAEMRYRDFVIMFSPEGGPGQDCKAPVTAGAPAPMSLYLYCEDVDALARRAESAGAKVLAAPADMFWGDRICTLVDPDGYRWTFATNVADFDPTKMPK